MRPLIVTPGRWRGGGGGREISRFSKRTQLMSGVLGLCVIGPSLAEHVKAVVETSQACVQPAGTAPARAPPKSQRAPPSPGAVSPRITITCAKDPPSEGATTAAIHETEPHGVPPAPAPVDAHPDQRASAAVTPETRASRVTLPPAAGDSAIVGMIAVGMSLLFSMFGCGLLVTAVIGGGSEDFAFRRQWGGLGGGSTGWYLSPRLLRYVGGLSMIALGVALFVTLQVNVTQLPQEQHPQGTAKPDPGAEGK